MIKQLGTVKQPELNEAYQRVLSWFFSYPTREMNLSDLARRLKISKTTANRVVSRLVKEQFLLLKEFGRVWQISCNQRHIYNFTRKVAYHFIMISESVIFEEIHKVYPHSNAIILFGSYRKGDDIETSDIDIALETQGNDNLKIIELGVFPSFGYRKNVVVHLHLFSRSKIDINLLTNIANGIVLEGILEVKS
ncbi:nucleotidyltransferase domain-containing protein [Candidatus Woesearchaeota archaeon]|nr:nucleotidyltransferase domain-containing protein [Candidatus Woesearchaeota archaeon]